MSPDLEPLENWAKTLLASMDGTSRTKLLRRVATELRKRNRARIRAQQNPDGSRFEARKRSRKIEDIKFQYRSEDGRETDRHVHSVLGSSSHLHGHDYSRGAFRSFRRDRIVKVYSSRRIVRKAAQRMMLGIARRMQKSAHRAGLEIDFGTQSGLNRIAEVHHYGLTSKVGKGNTATYSERRLLGISTADREVISDMIIEHIRRAA